MTIDAIARHAVEAPARAWHGGRHGEGRDAGPAERYATILGGAALAFAGLRRNDWVGTALAAAGGGLVLAGAAGVPVVNTVRERSGGLDLAGLLPSPDRTPTSTQANVTIRCGAERLFRHWRNFANLARLFPHLDRVDVQSATEAEWCARGPGGMPVRWRSVIDKERENELITWHTLEGAAFPHRGSVMFLEAPGGRGTQVRLTLVYRPPGGQGGRTVAALFGATPEQQARAALRCLKQVMETGEIPTIVGQPRGHRRMREMRE